MIIPLEWHKITREDDNFRLLKSNVRETGERKASRDLMNKCRGRTFYYAYVERTIQEGVLDKENKWVTPLTTQVEEYLSHKSYCARH